ncbi:SulP family inorganic anion transporter [Parapedobacter indicus]|uniref:Sulfate permease, SulP family n=1 Tax=Parapedobacter indicus TaxID=1477437 RepID=A0A1I3NEX2_9SPHI|nr:SulP family inorganic anion transporter [Parapedobacter indicus]PPL00963.1 SulP family sulfate permease [Parapedobacter indicus]SFJ07667.1 sulfate permease, SulP family [Parapedobacter indicus]
MFGTRTSAFLKLSKRNLKYDFSASIVVFLVALPLCLGIALASGAPLFAGLLTGIIGGIVIASFSGSQLSVSGPAAGLTVIVFGAIEQLGAFETFLLAVLLAGIIQIVLGIIRAGMIGNYFPSSVIIGMLAAIGIIIILKQLPHAVGYDSSFFGEESFVQLDNENTFTALQKAFAAINYGASIICILSLAILILWPKFKKLSIVPAPLVVVFVGVLLSQLFLGSSFELAPNHLVVIPVVGSFNEFLGLFTFPDFTQIANKEVWIAAFTIAIIASLETLLSLEAVDKIDPFKRVSPTNRELMAQGIGNMTSGLVGGLPLTAVIVRSSANVNAGGRTRQSAILHGIWLLLAVITIPSIINLIPLSCLAAILLHTGYKLAKPSAFKQMWHKGLDQFVPFVVTILAVVLTDLLTGVGIGLVVAMFYILRNNLSNAFEYDVEENADGAKITFTLAEEVTFLNKAAIQKALYGLPRRINEIIIDGSQSRFIDKDVIEVIKDFEQNAVSKGKTIELVGIVNKKNVPNIKRFTQAILKNDSLKRKATITKTTETI